MSLGSFSVFTVCSSLFSIPRASFPLCCFPSGSCHAPKNSSFQVPFPSNQTGWLKINQHMRKKKEHSSIRDHNVVATGLIPN